jgi:hypothetical protein
MSLVSIDNVTGTGAIQTVTIPAGPVASVAIHGRSGDVMIYGAAAGTEFYTVPSGSFISVSTHNMAEKVLYLKATAGQVIELLYQIVR